jgi:hypothetical protein
MTGFEIAGVVLVIGMLVGAIGGATIDNASKAKACLLCVELETSREMDVDETTVPYLGDEDMTLRPLPDAELPNP